MENFTEEGRSTKSEQLRNSFYPDLPHIPHIHWVLVPCFLCVIIWVMSLRIFQWADYPVPGSVKFSKCLGLIGFSVAAFCYGLNCMMIFWKGIREQKWEPVEERVFYQGLFNGFLLLFVGNLFYWMMPEALRIPWNIYWIAWIPLLLVLIYFAGILYRSK